MHSFTVDPDLAGTFPDLLVGFVAVTGLRNDEPWPEVERELAELEEQARSGTWTGEEHAPRIEAWHDAYRRFGVNPKRMRPSADALIRRLQRQHVLPRITPAVDAYNAVSVRFGLPAGAFDLDALPGDVVLRTGGAQDEFLPMGKPDEPEQPVEGEVVYASGRQVLTRAWNHRDSDTTKVGPGTRSAVFMVERAVADGCPQEHLSRAQEALADTLRPHCDAVWCRTLGADDPKVDLTPPGTR